LIDPEKINMMSTISSIFVCLPLFLLSISSVFIWKLQHEITLSKEVNLRSLGLLEVISERNQHNIDYEMHSRRLATSSVGNCSAVIEQALIPVGTILDFAGSVAPAGFLLCNGSAISRSKYFALLSVIGITYGVGDSLTTFNLPDLRGRTLVGAGTGTGLSSRALGAIGGEEMHQLSLSELARHNHVDAGHSHSGSWVSTDTSGVIVWFRNDANQNLFQSAKLTTGYASISDTGSDAPHNNMQPFGVANKIIKF
jgi:microcystin-dependent protein